MSFWAMIGLIGINLLPRVSGSGGAGPTDKSILDRFGATILDRAGNEILTR